MLLKKGADPRMEDNEGTTPFDLARNDDIRALFHDVIAEMDRKKDEAGWSASFLEWNGFDCLLS